MERVKGEKYWSVVQTMHGFEVRDFIDDFDEWDNADFEIGNRFQDRESTEAMVRKFRAVLKGADVIEMPSEEEMQTLETKDTVLAEFLRESRTDLNIIMHGRHAYWKGWNAAIRWLKSKIFK